MDPEPEDEATDEDVEAAADGHEQLPEFEELLDESEDDALEAICTKCGESHDNGACWDDQDDGHDAEQPELLGRYTVRDYGSPMLPLAGATFRHFEDADRVHIRERDSRFELARGGREEWPDYKVSQGSSQIALGAPAIDLIGVDEGDEVEVHTLGEDAVLVPPGEVVAIPEDEYRVGDPIDEDSPGAQEAEADGGVATETEGDALPSGVSPQDIRDAVDAVRDQQTSGKPYLGDVADELNVREARARLFCHEVGVYSDIIDASGYRGGA